MSHQLHTDWTIEDELRYFQLGKLLDAALEKYTQQLFPDGFKPGSIAPNWNSNSGLYQFGRYSIHTSPQSGCFGDWVYAPPGSSPIENFHGCSLNSWASPEQRGENRCERRKGLISLYAHVHGISEKAAMYRVAKELDLPIRLGNLLCASYLPVENAERVIERPAKDADVPVHAVFAAYGHSHQFPSIYYLTSDGRCHCIVHVHNREGHFYHIPYSAWMSPTGARIFEPTMPLPPYPLLDLLTLHKNQNAVALLAPNEYTVYRLRRRFVGVTGSAVITTWPCGSSAAIANVDWSPIISRPIIIMVEYSERGYRKARRVYEALIEAGAKIVNFISNREFHALPAECSQEEHDNATTRTLYEACIDGKTIDRNHFLLEANAFFHMGFDCRSHLHALPLDEFLAIPAPDMEWALVDLIRIKDRVLIYAPKGAGKTWFTTILYLCIATGRGFPNIWEKAGTPKNVLVINGEDSKLELSSRIESLKAGLNLPEGVFKRVRMESAALLGKTINLASEDARADLDEAIKWADVIVVDNLNSLWPESLQAGPESSADLNQTINELALKGKALIVINHASRKGESFGSSTKAFGMETVISVKEVPSYQGLTSFRVKFENIRWSAPKPPLTFTLVPEQDAMTVDIQGREGWTLDKDAEDYGDNASVVLDTSADTILDDLDDEMDADPEPELSPEEQLVRSLHEEGLSLRKIEERTRQMEAEGVTGVCRIPKSTVEKIIKKLRESGHLPRASDDAPAVPDN